MAQDVTEKSFICVEIVQDSVLNSFQSQRSANLKETYTLDLSLNGIIPGNYILRMTSKDGIILSTSQLIINQY